MQAIPCKYTKGKSVSISRPSKTGVQKTEYQHSGFSPSFRIRGVPEFPESPPRLLSFPLQSHGPGQLGKWFSHMGKWFPQKRKWFPDMGKWFPQKRKWFSDMGKRFPQKRKKFPDTGKSFPQTSKRFTDTGKRFPQKGKKFPQLRKRSPECPNRPIPHFPLGFRSWGIGTPSPPGVCLNFSQFPAPFLRFPDRN